MITFVLCGFGLLIVIAAIVGIDDARHAEEFRIVAAQRRADWERRRRGTAGEDGDESDDESDDDEQWHGPAATGTASRRH